MTAPAAVQPFDPRHARGISADARRVADRWLKDAAVRMNESLAEFGIEAKVSFQTVFTQDARTALANLADPDAAALLNIGKARIPAVMSFRTGLLLSLVQGLLGVNNTEWPADRALSPVEMSLAKMLFERFTVGLSDAWPTREVMPTSFVRPVLRTARARLFDPTTLLAVSQFQISCKAGDDSMLIVTTHEQLEQLCSEALPAAPPKATPSAKMADLAPLVPMPLSVELGRVQLSVSEAESLKLGDVLVLDQTTRDLLTAHVAGRPKFQGRPGRVGGRVCFAIDAVMED
jgi:flagellar motor switch protein FliM